MSRTQRECPSSQARFPLLIQFFITVIIVFREHDRKPNPARRDLVIDGTGFRLVRVEFCHTNTVGLSDKGAELILKQAL